MSLAANSLSLRGAVVESWSSFCIDKDPDSFADAYELFANWVDNSLDIYRVSLTEVDCFDCNTVVICRSFSPEHACC